MLSKDLLEQIEKLSVCDMITLNTITTEKCEYYKKNIPYYNVMKYNAKNRQKINDNAKEAYKKKKELKKNEK